MPPINKTFNVIILKIYHAQIVCRIIRSIPHRFLPISYYKLHLSYTIIVCINPINTKVFRTCKNTIVIRIYQ